MATDEPGNSERPSSHGALSNLDSFLAKFVELIKQTSTGMFAQATDADEKELMAAYASPLNEQVVRLAELIRQDANGCSRQQLEEVEMILRLSAAHTLTESGTRMTQNLRSQRARIGISDIVTLIKKILKKLLEIFHISLPDWFWDLMDLIDEILNFLLSAGNARLASTLSKRHQDFMMEMTHLTRLQKATASRAHDDQDEAEE